MGRLRKLLDLIEVQMPQSMITLRVAKGLAVQASPDVCQECHTDHGWNEVHHCGSTVYQYQFYLRHDRFPTWTDAMAHCAEADREIYRKRILAIYRKKGWTPPYDLMRRSDTKR